MAQVSLLKDFPRTFWTANVMELFERAAYYGLNSVLAVYLTLEVAKGGLGFDVQSVGFLQSLVYAATYVVPILGGALADQYGYRRMLLVSFVLMSAGYYLSGSFTDFAPVFASLLLMAVGGGLFKPIISGTIARTTNERTSAFGFGIYYWMINLGAFLAPIVVSYLRGFSWRYVFIASAAYTAAMLLPALFVYTDPPRPESTRTLRQALVGAAEVLSDARFMLMVVIYSGFWVLYFQNFGTVLWYLGDFIDTTSVDRAMTAGLAALGFHVAFKLDAEFVTVVNAGTIILLQVLVSRIVKDAAALPTMVAGMALGAVGFVLLALSQNPWVFIAGIAVFSIGEMTAHPKYYSYIGLVAPPDRKAVYMGYAFLYGVFGSLLGSNIGALLYASILKPVVGAPDPGARPFVFWMLFAVLDVVAMAGLMLFARRFGEDNPETRRRATVAMTVVYGLLGALGVVFLVVAFGGETVQYKTAVQATLFILLGAAGIAVTRRTRPSAP